MEKHRYTDFSRSWSPDRSPQPRGGKKISPFLSFSPAVSYEGRSSIAKDRRGQRGNGSKRRQMSSRRVVEERLPSPSSAVSRPFEETIENERFENLERSFFLSCVFFKSIEETINGDIYIYKDVTCFFHVYPWEKERDLNGTVCSLLRERSEAMQCVPPPRYLFQRRKYSGTVNYRRLVSWKAGLES